ncbi:SDR family NAD(P)-dependent oxidoreductase [Novosphingobium colocasiae]|uniref:SDR family NAD(P)-dependent oxidoreductase n=1 Tax=Novosphingobium colocasiae TaxID=1256513 RepID=UPI0035B4CE3F
MSQFEGKAALVTGAGSGIGRATSLALAADGAYVWVTDFDKASADRTVEMIVGQGGRAVSVKLDVSVEKDWQTAFGRIDSGEEALSILVNCAGKSILADSFTMPLEELRRVMAINVEGAFLGMKHAIPRIAKSGGGAVINISSIMGLKGKARMAAYCASKGAVRMMTKAIALECADLKNNVRVNSVHPGVVDTPAWAKHDADEAGMMLGSSGKQASATLDVHAVAKALVPIGVAASAEEIAATVCFLASDVARHITGAEIVIDGGMTAD